MAVDVAATRAERPRRLIHWHLLISTLVGVAALGWSGAQLHSPWGGSLPGSVLSVTAIGVVALACRDTARSSTDPLVRRFWWGLGICATAVAAGLLLGIAGEIGGVPYTAYPATIMFAVGVLALGGALMTLRSARRTRYEWLTLMLDVSTVMLGAGLFVWYLSGRFGILSAGVLNPQTLVLLGLVGAMGTLIVVQVGLALPSPIRHLTLGLLGLGALAAAVVSGLAALIEHPVVDGDHVSSPVAALFWVAAAFVQQRSTGRAIRPRRHSARLPFNLLPYVSAVAVGGLVLIAGPASGSEGMLVRGAVLFVALVLARQMAASYDNARLLRRVDAGMLELRRHEQRFRSMVQQAADIIVITAPDGGIDYASPALRMLVGPPGGTPGARVRDFVHPEDMPVVSHHANAVAAVPGSAATFRARVSDASGSWRWLEVISTNLLADPSVRGIISNARDITDMLHYQEKLAHQATHDELTSLPNRALLLDRVRSALADPAARAGVALVDLDDFKEINDRLGHDVGDALLVAVGELLSRCVGPDDTVARLGGDEFGVVLAGASPEDATTVLDEIMSALETPIVAAGYDLLVQASIGLANGAPGGDPTELLRRADVALYAAKEQGKGRQATFDFGMDQRSIQHAEIGAELRQALDAGDQLYLLYQPIVGLPEGRVSGVEALVRWRHPERGIVSPVDFIPLAERTGLIIPLGRWILREACGQAARWADDPRTARLTVSVNVSARQLRDPGFPGDLKAALAETGLDPMRLTVEVTETAVFDSDVAVETLRTVHALGVRVALDDFGTGHSSLGLLRSCPVDILKVDKSFVDGVTGTAEQAAIAISLIQITSTMRLAAVAEGVETAEQAVTLHRLGYRFAQGFHFARPLPSEEIADLLGEPIPATGPVKRAIA